MGVQLSKISHVIIFILLIPAISIGLTLIINSFLQEQISAPWILLIDSAGVLGIYTILFKIFNDCLWQIFPQGMLSIIDVPNLNGSWMGKLRSSYDGNSTAYDARIEIIQTFSNIKVFGYFGRSWSQSIVADFYKEGDGREVLHYVYRNEPRNSATPGMNGHYGAGKHEYLKSRDMMECSYYNEPPRGRGWFGKFNVKRKKISLLRLLFPTLGFDFK
jgi:hypothetical protein